MDRGPFPYVTRVQRALHGAMQNVPLLWVRRWPEVVAKYSVQCSVARGRSAQGISTVSFPRRGVPMAETPFRFGERLQSRPFGRGFTGLAGVEPAEPVFPFGAQPEGMAAQRAVPAFGFGASDWDSEGDEDPTLHASFAFHRAERDRLFRYEELEETDYEFGAAWRENFLKIASSARCFSKRDHVANELLAVATDGDLEKVASGLLYGLLGNETLPHVIASTGEPALGASNATRQCYLYYMQFSGCFQSCVELLARLAQARFAKLTMYAKRTMLSLVEDFVAIDAGRNYRVPYLHVPCP